ncbi:hypothetical protein M0812_03966 [Anaeramoeba flamelloides]|uniref:Uncharacterized protein n=1 Tax=Anaeramoeba flamelloides TaxID=1746091 RepID=A0AAV8ADJ2_9EUKA|nr:hypothetical protein M0812_03966 [Anaeramoeba flamelloides]
MPSSKGYTLPKSPLRNEICVQTFQPQAYKKLPTTKIGLLKMLLHRYLSLILKKRNSKFLGTLFLFVIAIFFIFSFVSISLYFSKTHETSNFSRSYESSQKVLANDLPDQIAFQNLIAFTNNQKEQANYLPQINKNLNER